MNALPLRSETPNWQPGDLALCIKADPWFNELTNTPTAGPEAGSIHRVATVAAVPGRDVPYLTFDEWPDDLFESPAFRRITPDLPTEADREIAATKRRAREPVPA